MSNNNKIVVHKNRTNVVTCNLGINITGDTITSEIRTQPEHDAPLIVPWTVAVITASTGEITLTIDNGALTDVPHRTGFMDIKRVTGGEPITVFDEPLEVEFRGTVTA